MAIAGWAGPCNDDNDTAKFSAVVRDWERRFGARVVAAGFSTLHLSVAAPPANEHEALLVAAEHFAFCPDNTTSLVVGDESDSYLGEVLTDRPHPLSAFQVNIGSASLRGSALMFAAAAASSSDEHAWVRDQATELPGSRDEHDVHEAAAALCGFPNDIAGIVDPGLLATHDHFGVRQAGAVLCMRFPPAITGPPCTSPATPTSARGGPWPEPPRTRPWKARKPTRFARSCAATRATASGPAREHDGRLLIGPAPRAGHRPDPAAGRNPMRLRFRPRRP
ncbi:DUF4253 domain-containing protein [Streptomyces yokosukanensis]|uniref:DUF4253 domain-containing protein n=1 Tax=Streptomyces yokosukanensis TaxID=67386 RepID=UPI00342F28E6